ncbi:hypothetical protein Kpol_534p55 [Vanderwaltozyma polyspora DSM 70294]|uniref:Uncharacterized protein n=1 Tax=Vanderwaltozyma polyspora (strain ATCC 22028 / DSM 70294 / BCRC 21397 / CBS 2163 / NBRC 10782 / NRRL Y-8283 / UCD 57-17) TaxID=436907 RepID=A7TJN1_VANPO|nr:uncharacterized protein Kpol_534p55 [Vanderwaltozyma polyspora DSM 70294]EDO17574.1 hypothetical protein Kpol_534p55 [Vanderwaltozyma polyspora DSM 70294]
MNVVEFAEAQKGHYKIYPPLKKRKMDHLSIPFVKLLHGNETITNLERRWELYHQLHSHFHFKVDDIIANIETDLKSEIFDILFNRKDSKDKECFKTLFLLGSDSSTRIDLPKSTEDLLSVLIELTPKESPNVRMMLKRSMFKLHTAAESDQQNLSLKEEEQNQLDNDIQENKDVIDEADYQDFGDVSYDLTFVENFKKKYGKNINLVFNFKDVDSINFSTLDNFLILLKSALKNQHVDISLVFNINTNLSNIQKNLKQSTIRLLKKNYHKLDVSSNKGYKYGNRIFQSFLDTVDGKLNLSERFVQFILDKMANNTNHNLQLLTKILDYSLMTYFYENPFSVFIDPVNVEVLDDTYLKLLTSCPTFMFFIEGLLQQNAPSDEIMNLLTNKNKNLEEFFVDFLVRENPINGHAKFVAKYLEEELNITNYNLIELYKNLLNGKLEDYLKRWPKCKEQLMNLKFEPVDTIFQELFTLDNNSGLLTQALFPLYKSNIEDNLLNWERSLPSLNKESHASKEVMFERSVGPILSELFKLYREASANINLYDFYSAFRESVQKELLLPYIDCLRKQDEELDKILEPNSDTETVDKITLALFMQTIFEFEHMGFIKGQNSKNYDFVEKCIWRGI